MRAHVIVANVVASLMTAVPNSASAFQTQQSTTAHEDHISLGKGSLYVRDIGRGPPIIVVHGGPDFDQTYLLPEFDRLASSYHLIYYDQRGRGKSADGVQAEDVSFASDVEDIDRVREHFHLETVAVLGHSWGAVLALEYALRHPTRLSHLILMNPAPASAGDRTTLRKAYLQKLGADMDRQRTIIASAAYQSGDPEAVAARYRIHFEAALARPADYETLMAKMRAAFISQGSGGIVKARAVEDRLMADTWDRDSFDLLPELRGLSVPAVVIAGERDFIPGEVAEHIAHAIPNARLVTIANCGHFSYLECPADARRAVDELFRRPAPKSPWR